MKRKGRALLVATGLTLGALQACVGSDVSSSPGDGDADAGDTDAGDTDAGDAASRDSTAVDASDSATAADRNVPVEASAPRCSPTGIFGKPTSLLSLNTSSNDEAARLSPDELTLYFSSDRAGGSGGFDIWMATRASLTATFGAPTPVPGINTTGDERDPTVTSDGRTLYATISGAGYPTGNNIGIATRATTAVDFGALVPLSSVNADGGAFNSTNPFVLPDDSAIYFSSDPSGKADIFRSARVSGSFTTPAAINGSLIDSADNENIAALTPDQLTLFFASDRSGGVGFYDVWIATRANSADPFDAPLDLAAVNTDDLDFPSWVSADGCVLYITNFHAPGDGGARTYDIFVAARGM